MGDSIADQRSMSGNHIGAHSFVNQGNISNYYSSTAPATAGSGPARACVCVVPYPRNTDIVDRPDLRLRLEALLSGVHEHEPVALWGLGGSGKTQLVLEYAYKRFNPQGCSVFWVHADNETTFARGYQSIAAKLKIDSSIQGDGLLRAVRAEIENQPSWVLVVDNADDLGLFGVSSKAGSTDLLEHIPQGQNGTILWTSRDKAITSIVGARRAFEVSKMTTEESMALFTTGLGGDAESLQLRGDNDDSNTLTEELHHLALAISQASAFMLNTSTSVKEYLALLREARHRNEVLGDNTQHDRHRQPGASNSIFATWSISIERLLQGDPTAHRILHVLAYLGSQDIPLDLIEAVSGCDENSLVSLKSSVGRLVAFSFLSRRQTEDGSESYDMHMLVQEATRYTHRTAPTVSQCPGDNIGPAHPEQTAEHYVKLAVQAVLRLFQPKDLHHPSAAADKYVTHAAEVGRWDLVPLQAAQLLRRVGRYMFNTWRFDEALSFDLRCLAIQQAALGKREPRTLTAMHNVAATLTSLQRYTEAETILEELCAILQEVMGENHQDTLRSMRLLARAQNKQGRHVEAGNLLHTIVERQREACGDEDPGLWDTRLALARFYKMQQRYQESEALLRNLQASSLQSHGENHRKTSKVATELGIVLWSQGRNEEARDLMLKNVASTRKSLGEKHVLTLFAAANLAIMYHALGEKEEALGLMKQCHAAYMDMLGKDHEKTQRSAEFLESWTS